MMSWVRRLWPFYHFSQSSPGAGRWWWPGDWAKRGAPVAGGRTAEVEEAARLVVVHAGGAAMRATASLHSAKVGALRRGEVVTVVKEDAEARRARVRTSEGHLVWISTCTADGTPIVRRVTASTSYKRKDMPLEGTAAFADAFEARWQEKWQRLRVEADRKESKPHSIRSSPAGMPIRAWRPSIHPREGGNANLRARVRKRPLPPSKEPVPKLENPPSARKRVEIQEAEELALEEQDLPDLIAFDTWPRTSRSKANGQFIEVPSLAELLGGKAPVPQAPQAVTSAMGVVEGDIDDDLGKEALVFNTEPTSRDRARFLVDAAAPRRSLSLGDAGEKPPGEDPGEVDAFQYLLKNIAEQDLQEDVGEATTEAMEAKSPEFIARDDGRPDDATANELLIGLAASPTAIEVDDAPTPSAGFQFEPLPRTWAKRSVRKQPRFPTRGSRAVEADLDVERFDDDDDVQAATDGIGLAEGGDETPERADSVARNLSGDAFGGLLGEPIEGHKTSQHAVFEALDDGAVESCDVRWEPGKADEEPLISPQEPCEPPIFTGAASSPKGNCLSGTPVASAEPCDRASQQHEHSSVEKPTGSPHSRHGHSELPSSSRGDLMDLAPGSMADLEAGLTDLSLTPAAGCNRSNVAPDLLDNLGDVPDLSANPFFDPGSAEDGMQSSSARGQTSLDLANSRPADPPGHGVQPSVAKSDDAGLLSGVADCLGDEVPDLSTNPFFDPGTLDGKPAQAAHGTLP